MGSTGLPSQGVGLTLPIAVAYEGLDQLSHSHELACEWDGGVGSGAALLTTAGDKDQGGEKGITFTPTAALAQ